MTDERPVYTPENTADIETTEFRPTKTIFAVRIDGPFTVEDDADRNDFEDGWLILDFDGNEIGGMEHDEFTATYEPLFLDEPDVPSTPPDAAEKSDEPAVREAVGLLPLDTPALVSQLAHRNTYLELVVTGLLRQLVTQNILARDFEQRSIETADRALAGEQRARATTPGRGGLVALELVPAAPKE